MCQPGSKVMHRRISVMPVIPLAVLALAQGALAFAPSAAFTPSKSMAALSQRSARHFVAARSGRPLIPLRMSDQAEYAEYVSSPAPQQSVTTSSPPVVLIAQHAAINTGPPGREQQQQQQQGRMYYEEQAQPRGELQMEKGHLNTALLVGSGVATLAGGYFGVKFYQKRQQQLVDEFGRAMMFYVGDDKLTRDCIKEYKGKLGLLINGFHKMDMFKAYAMRLTTDKPLGIQTLEHFRKAGKLMGVNPAKAIQQAAVALVPHTDPKETWQRNANKPSVLGKLLWLTERCYPDAATIKALRARFPKSYGDEIIDVLQNTLTEEAYKAILEKAGGPSAGVQPGYEELGYSKAEATVLVAKLVEEARIAAEEAARKAEEAAEAERVIMIREGAVKGQKEKANLKDGKVKTHGEVEKPKEEPKAKDDSAPHEYECSACGYTLFVAKGREFKFFGDNFKCPTCGAGKEFFKDNSIETKV